MNQTEKKTALSLIDERAALFEGIADRIWENPELSLKDYKARDLYCRALRELGFSVTENLCGIGTAFCGSYGSGRPVIGILGEFDALSGLSQEAGAISPKPVTEGGCGQIHSGRGYGEFLDTVLQTECTKISSSFCDRHDFDYSCFRLVKIRKNGQANNSGILTPLTEAS